MARFAGIDVVSLANNHSLDFGRPALLDTLRYVRRAGIEPVGGGPDLTAARRPAILELGGLRVAFLGYSDVRPPGFDAAAGVPGAAPAFEHLIGADVRAAKRKADLAVVYFHWGIERSRTPSGRQHALAAAALNAGATVVLGAHPHVLQPVSAVPGRRLVAWSLGNFVFAAHSPGTADTGILLVHLNDKGVAGHVLRRARIAGVQPRLLSPWRG
jgi:poly-gamma-glutamate synthesis protein (capsule biosynthesis protein)